MAVRITKEDKMRNSEQKLRLKVRNAILKKMDNASDGGEWTPDELYKMAATLEKLDKRSTQEVYADAFLDFHQWLTNTLPYHEDMNIKDVKKLVDLMSEFMTDKFNIKV